MKEILEGGSALRQAQGPQLCGVFTKAGDLKGFVAAIEELSQHSEWCAEMG